MTRRCIVSIPVFLVAVATALGCQPFAISTPGTFIELDENRRSSFAYRATTADGVVLAVRVTNNDQRGTLAFWLEAVRNKLCDVQGYALLEETEVRAPNGIAGHQLRLGRDQSGRTYHYWVTLYARHQGRAPRVWVVEVGGEQELFERRRPAVDAALASFTPR